MSSGFKAAFTQALCVVAVAELFDKTWFMAVLCSLNYGARVSFVAASSALFLHTLVAATLGVVISRIFSVSVLHFATAGIFALLAAVYAYEWVKTAPGSNALEERSQEAKDALGSKDGAGSVGMGTLSARLAKVFVAIFIAEWGDRTQISMISLHASLPVVPVCLGSTVAFLILTLSAVLVASLLEGQRLGERFVLGISAASFLVFSLLAIVDGARALRAEHEL